MKNLKEVHFPTEVTVIQLENIARRIFEVNRTTFSDDELPLKGAGHNQVLHITVKCELLCVTRVLDEGSAANICPLSAIQKLNVSAVRVQPNNICARVFDGPKTYVFGEIDIVVTIGPVEFTVKF